MGSLECSTERTSEPSVSRQMMPRSVTPTPRCGDLGSSVAWNPYRSVGRAQLYFPDYDVTEESSLRFVLSLTGGMLVTACGLSGKSVTVHCNAWETINDLKAKMAQRFVFIGKGSQDQLEFL